MAETFFERFRRQMDDMQFESMPLFSRPHFSWNLRTDYVGRRLVYRPRTDSTQDDARGMLSRWPLPSGAIILAEGQTSGRGRDGRAWVSPPDVGLYFTLLVYTQPETLRSLAYVTPLAIALAAEEAVAKQGASIRAGLKWPNDILIDDRKLAGVLIETTESQDGEPVALVGVGINVNLDVAIYPEIASIATSLRDALGYDVPREEVLAAFCNHFEALYAAAVAGSTEPFEAWKQRLVTLGRDVIATGAETIRGRAIDVDPDGALIIETAAGARIRVYAGDVTLSATPE
jgi:BirA family biotin operon repressor/biotin-[acetyl-CoA-carboxylase] ligase